MADTDLTTTLRITPQMDQQAVNALGDQVASAVNQRLNQGLSTGAAGGAGVARPGGTTSTAAQVPPPGMGAPPSAAQTTSTSYGAARQPLPQLGSGTRSTTGGAANYMAGSSTTQSLLTGLYQDRLPQAAIALGTGAFRESLMETARYKAQMIEDMRASGTPESMLPGMGALRFAGPIGIAASVVGAFAAQNIGEGLDLQEKYSRRNAALGPAMVRGVQTGALRPSESYSDFLYRAGSIRNGALSDDEARQAMETYSGIGFRDKAPLDYLRLGMTGVSQDTIRALRANMRLGATAGQSDIEGFVGTAQSAGLVGRGVDDLLGQIAASTKAMAMRGVRLDPMDTRRMLDRGVAAGLSPEIVQSGLDRASGNVMSLRDQALSPFKGYGDAMVQMRALRGARSYEEYVGNLEGLAGSPTDLASTLRRGGRLVSAAYYGTGLKDAVTGLPAVDGEGQRQPEYMDSMFVPGGGLDASYRRRRAIAQNESFRYQATQSAGAFEAQQALAAGGDVRSMQWSFINDMKASLLEAIGQGQVPLMTKIDSLINVLRENAERQR